MPSIEEILQQMVRNPGGVAFNDLRKVCVYYFSEFGTPRQRGDHIIYKIPWSGDPRINIQNDKGKAKAYQVKQVLKAIEKLRAD